MLSGSLERLTYDEVTTGPARDYNYIGKPRRERNRSAFLSRFSHRRSQSWRPLLKQSGVRRFGKRSASLAANGFRRPAGRLLKRFIRLRKKLFAKWPRGI